MMMLIFPAVDYFSLLHYLKNVPNITPFFSPKNIINHTLSYYIHIHTNTHIYIIKKYIISIRNT